VKVPGQRSFFVFYVVAAVFIIGLCAGVYSVWKSKQRKESDEVRSRAALVEAGPAVTIATSVRGPSMRKINLVGEALPFATATLYAKVSGYLTRIGVDTGDKVKAGQFIAEIQSPEIDQQINTARVALENKRRLLDRTRDLAEKGFFSKQTLDNAETDVEVAESQMSELRTLSGYRTLKAPFTGVVTARYADPGALVTNAASNQSSALPVVTISDTSRLKVTVYVEQSEAPNVKIGTQAEIVDAASPDRRVDGRVTRVSGELDPRTRTLLTEVDFDNSKGQFLAGSFVNVSLVIPSTSYVEVPVAALVVRDRKNLVAALTPDNRIQLIPITVAGTDGKMVRIADGLGEGERVVLGLPSTLADGSRVTLAIPPPTAAAPAKPISRAPPAEAAR
jgi:membrane fusion protein, multidrug efflux system